MASSLVGKFGKRKLRSLAMAMGIGPLLITAVFYALLPPIEETLPYAKLFQFQLNKIESLDPTLPTLIFVGDSSLGNAVNAKFWQRIVSEDGQEMQVVSLALTGVFGIAGNYNMIRRAKEALNVQSVILIQAPDGYVREVSEKLFIMTSPSSKGDSILPKYWADIKERLNQRSLEALFSFGKYTQKNIEIHNDYIRQGEPKTEINYGTYLPTMVNKRNLKYLKKISRFCELNSLECLYAHGPMADPFCSIAGGYIDAVNDLVYQSDLPLVHTEPVCFSKSDLGDSSNHVSPHTKDKYTSVYYDLVNKYQTLAK